MKYLNKMAVKLREKKWKKKKKKKNEMEKETKNVK